MRIRYVGPHKRVDIASTGQSCDRGEIVDVKAKVARELVKQKVWEKVPEVEKESPDG